MSTSPRPTETWTMPLLRLPRPISQGKKVTGHHPLLRRRARLTTMTARDRWQRTPQLATSGTRTWRWETTIQARRLKVTIRRSPRQSVPDSARVSTRSCRNPTTKYTPVSWHLNRAQPTLGLSHAASCRRVPTLRTATGAIRGGSAGRMSWKGEDWLATNYQCLRSLGLLQQCARRTDVHDPGTAWRSFAASITTSHKMSSGGLVWGSSGEFKSC